MDVSPKYLMNLIEQIDSIIWKEFVSYKNAEFYIKKWQIGYNYNDPPNFIIHHNGNAIDLKQTLHGIDGETLLKIAIDLGIETLQFIPSIPMIKNTLKVSYSTAFNAFDQAIKQVESNPDLAVGLANSTLESIIKHILQGEKIAIQWNEKDTLYKLTESVLKQFQFYPSVTIPVEIKTIGSSLLSISQAIEGLRSDKTIMHGKLAKDYIIDEPMYACFVVNLVASIGLFLISFYEKNYKSESFPVKEEVDTEISPDDIPF